jgi:hypothetical protein
VPVAVLITATSVLDETQETSCVRSTSGQVEEEDQAEGVFSE